MAPKKKTEQVIYLENEIARLTAVESKQKEEIVGCQKEIESLKADAESLKADADQNAISFIDITRQERREGCSVSVSPRTPRTEIK